MAAAKEKFSLKGFGEGLKTLFTRNAILIILANALIGYGNTMKNTYRSLFAANMLNMNRTMIGTTVTFFLLMAALFGPFGGTAADKFRKWIKPTMVVILVVRFVVFIAFDWVGSVFGYYFVNLLDAITFAFTNAVMPALLAISVDRRAMGTSYAVSVAVVNVASSSASQVGVSLFNTYGVFTAAAVAGGLGLISAVLICFMDGKKLNMTKKENIRASKAKFGICISMLPLCLIAGAMASYNQFYRNFIVVVAEDLSINCLPYMTIGQAINGVLAVVIGVVCDFIDPFILVLISLIGLIPVPLGWAAGASNPMLFNLATACLLPLMYNQTAMRILGMKTVAAAQQGSFQATYGMCSQIAAMIASTLIGLLLDLAGFQGSMYILCGWGVFLVVAFVLVYTRSIRKAIQESQASSGSDSDSLDQSPGKTR